MPFIAFISSELWTIEKKIKEKNNNNNENRPKCAWTTNNETKGTWIVNAIIQSLQVFQILFETSKHEITETHTHKICVFK